MDKSKSKDDLRAAGKKRLEEFRQKKQQKGGSNKSSSTTIKALADGKSLSGISVSPASSVTQQDTESHEKADGQPRNVAMMLELEVEAPQQVQSSLDDGPVPGDSKLEMPPITGRKPFEPEPLGPSEAVTSAESKTSSEWVSELDPPDQNRGRECDNKREETAECSKDSKISPPFGSGEFLQGEHSSDEITSKSKQDNALDIQSEQTIHEEGGEIPKYVDKTPVALQESVKQDFITEIEALKRELQTVVEQKELVSSQLVVKAEQQLQDADKVKSLITDMESIQRELYSVKNEKLQLVEEFNLSQVDIENTNRQLAAELKASQEQFVAVHHRASLLSGELERSKQEVVEAGTKSAIEMESMQKLLKDGEVRMSQLMEELGTTKILLQGVQDEKTFINDELRRFEKELRVHGGELLQKGNELETSKQRIQTLEEDLASERKTLQQVQKLVADKSEMVEVGRLSNEKLEAQLLAKEVELGSCGDHILGIESEKCGLVHQVEEFKLHLDLARQKEEGVRAELEAESKANEEQLKQLQDEKVELLDALRKSEFLSKQLSDERSSLLAAFDSDREQLRQDVRQKEEENMNQSKQLQELRQEFQKLGEEHSQVAKEIEIALDECRIALYRESDEKSKAKLISARDQLLLLIEEKGQEVAHLGNQLQEYKDQLRSKVEENLSLMLLLEESSGKLQETANRVSQFEVELKKQKAVSDGLLAEKETLAAEMLEFQAEREHMQQTAKEHERELERVKESWRVLQEDHTILSGRFTLTADKLTIEQAEKSAVELELATYKEQMPKLVEENSTLVKLLEDNQNDLQRVREDNLLSSSEIKSELEKRRVLFSDLLVEKETLASELQLAIEQSQHLQQELAQSENKYISELEGVRIHWKELEDSHSKLSDDLTQSHREMAMLKEEKCSAELEVASSKEQLTKLKDATKGLRGELDRHREQLDVALQEKEQMLGDHVAELDKFRERQRDVEETKIQQTARLQRTEFMLEESKGLERKLKEENVLLGTELADQRERQQDILEEKVKEIEKLQQQVKELVQLQEHMAREVAKTQERFQVLESSRLELLSNADVFSQKVDKISSEKDVLQRDLDLSKEQLQGLEDEKANLILRSEVAFENWKVEKLQLSRDLEVSLENEKLLSAGKAQVDSEMAELMLKTLELDAQRVQLAMEVGALKESIESSEEQLSHLVSQVEGKDRLLQTLAEEKSQLDSHLQKERERITVYSDQVVQFEENVGTTKLRIQELELETARLRADFKYSQTQVELLTEERTKLVEDLSIHLSHDEKLKKAIEENLHLRDVREQLEGKQHEVDNAFVRLDELENQVRELTESVVRLQAEKDTALEALLSTQEELGQSNHTLADERVRLRVSEGTAAALQTERDELVGKLEVAEQRHTHLSERALQDSKDKMKLKDQLAAFEVRVAEYDIELRNQKDMVSQSKLLVQSLVQNLEDLVRDVFPKAGQELLSLQSDKVSADYHNLMVSRLHIETKEVCHQLQNAHVQLSEMNQQLQDAKDQFMILQKESTVAVESAAEITSQWIKAADEKEKLETSLKSLEAIVSAENLRKDEQAVTFANLQSERDDLAGKLEILEQNHIHVSEWALQDSQDKVSLQDQVAALKVQVSECNTELSKHKDMLIDSNLVVLSLVNKLEDLICEGSPEAGQELRSSQYEKYTPEYHQILVSRLRDQKEMLIDADLLVLSLVEMLEDLIFEAFPEAGQELRSSQYDKHSPEYHHILVSRLHIEATEVCQRLKKALDLLTRVEEQFAKAEDALMILQKERTMAAESDEQIRSQLMRAVEEKEELETSLKRLEATHAETVRVDEQVSTLADEAKSEVERLVLQIESLDKQLENANAEKESLQKVANTIANQATSEVESLVVQIENLNKHLENANAEKEYLQTAFGEAEQKLSATREKLSLAINKGKAVVQQRDAWKLALAEKSKELEMLVAGHQQDLQDKDAALNEAEKKIVNLTASVEQMTRLELQLDFFQSMITTAEEVVLENEHLFHTLSAVLNNVSLPGDWHSIHIANKMRWITGCLSTLLQEREARRKEVLTLMEHEATLTSSVEQSDVKVTAIAKQLRSVEHEKQELVSRIEEGSNDLQLERAQMAEEKSQLTGIIRQQDLNIEMHKRESENLATRVEERDKEIVQFEADIASLITKVTEQKSELNTQALSYDRLDVTLKTLFSKLSDCYEAISLVHIDKVSRDSPLDCCKYIVMLLIDNQNLTVRKLEEILDKAYLLRRGSEEAVKDGLSQSLDDKSSSKEISSGLIEVVDDAFTSLEQQVSSLAEERNEKNRLQLELTQKEDKLRAERTQLMSEISSLQRDLAMQREEREKRVQHHKEASDKSGELMYEISSLQQEIVMQKEENDKLVQDYKAVSDKCGELMSEITTIQQELATQKDERDRLVQDFKEASDKYAELRSQTEEITKARAMLLGESETLQQRIAELETALDGETHARMKLESYAEAVVVRIQNSTKRPVMEKSVESLTSNPHNSKYSSQLDSLSPLVVVQLEAALQEIEELSERKALLAESQQTMMEKASSEREMLEQLQQRLASRDLELSEACKKLDEANSRREREEAASKGFLEEVHMLREELAKGSSERDAVRSELVQIEQKGAITREKLGLAIKKGKGVAQQRDLLKQSLSEQESLVVTCKEELQIKDSALKKVTDQLSMCEEKAQALELNVSSLNSFVLALEQELHDKDNLTQKMEAVLTRWDFPREWQSRDITEKLEWLVVALSNAQNSLIVAGQESDALKEASAQFAGELTDAQTRADLEQESRLMLGIELEECMGRLRQSQKRIAELENLMAEVGGVSQQTVLDLSKSLDEKQAEVKIAEDAVMAWIKRSEESEKYIQLCQGRISELENTVQESSGAQQQIELLHDKLARLEEMMQQKDAAVKAVETSRGKAINKLTLTTNKFRELYQQSEGLVAELERMHKDLQEKDAEIIQLKEDVVKISSESQKLQEALKSNRSFQLQLEELLKTAALSGADSAVSPPRAQQEDSDRLAYGNSDEERCIGLVHFLQNQLSSLTVQSQARQADVERKDVQLQGLRSELDEVVAEKAQLKANLLREQNQSENLKAEIASMHTPLTERGIQADEIEEAQVGKRLLPVNTPTPHVRGTRRPAPIDVAIDVDPDRNQLLVRFDDKGHGFKSLTSSRFMPRGTRAIGEQIDRLCMAGGRVLMRQPAARLLVALYWLAIHIWMVFLITAAHV